MNLEQEHISGWFPHKSGEDIEFGVYGYRGYILISVGNCETLDTSQTLIIHEAFVNDLGLERYDSATESTSTSLPSAPSNIWSMPFSAFLSYDFELDRAIHYANTITKFLNLLDVEVDSGRPFQPRRVEDKVREQLSGKDLIVSIVTGSEQPTWLRDELVVAHAQGCSPFILIERPAQIVTEMLGNIEYIEFDPGAIEKTFIPILQGLRHLERARTRMGQPIVIP